jgi:hypothetical protein
LALALTSPPTKADRAKAKPKKAKAVGTPLPADWKPSEAHEAYAKQRGIDLELTADAFRGNCDGKTAVSWNGRFSTWLANEAKWAKHRGPRRVPPAAARLRRRASGQHMGAGWPAAPSHRGRGAE